MSLKKVVDFFKNRVTIELKTGHKFEGLLSRIDYKNNIVVLEDVEQLANVYSKQEIPHDAKFEEKPFEAENIQEILFTHSHFVQPKKYNPDDFFDSMSEEPKTFERGENHKYQRGRGGGRSDQKGRFKKSDKEYKNREYKPKKAYEEKGKYNKKEEGSEEDERDYR